MILQFTYDYYMDTEKKILTPKRGCPALVWINKSFWTNLQRLIWIKSILNSVLSKDRSLFLCPIFPFQPDSVFQVTKSAKCYKKASGTYLAFCSHITVYNKFVYHLRPASVAQLDARPTGDQEVAGSNPAEVGNILSWRLIMKYFLRSFSP